MIEDEEGFLTVQGFLERYAVSRTGLYREVKRGNLQITKIGRASRIARKDARAWAASLPVETG